MKNKGVKISVTILAILILLALVVYFTILSSSTVKAQLNVESGEVLVNDAQVEGNLKLSQGDVVETKQGLASIILYESLVINLEKNTKISLDELTASHPKVSQEGGETWNQFTNLFGMESYSIQSGNSVAAVRGTGFSMSEDKLLVEEGEIDYQANGQGFLVGAGRAVEQINGIFQERNLTPQEIAALKLKRQRAIEQLKKLRELEIQKHPKLLNIIKSRLDFTDEEIQQTLLDADEGKIDFRELKEKSPIKLKVNSVEKIIEITDKIKELKSR